MREISRVLESAMASENVFSNVDIKRNQYVFGVKEILHTLGNTYLFYEIV